MTLMKRVSAFLGLDINPTSHKEKCVSALGAGLSIFLVSLCSYQLVSHDFIGIHTAYFIVASMGASAVLLFAVPHGALSQPWPVVGGNLISAFIGVTCVLYLPHEIWVGGIAVGLAVGVMYYLRCIHPPGGATALTAVVGGAEVYELGYQYMLVPVLINVAIILSVAFVFNNIFPWRSYPASFARKKRKEIFSEPSERENELTQEDFSAAMQEFDSYFDITVDDLTDLLEAAKKYADHSARHPDEIKGGSFYSNGKIGRLWSVRQVIDEADTDDASKDKVIFKVMAGDKSYETGICRREEFKQWARFEVFQKDGHWIKVNHGDDSVDVS